MDGGTAGLRGGYRAHPQARDPTVPGEGREETYLGCPARGHSEPLTITRQLLPAERWVPWSKRWVPPPRGPNRGCRLLMRGSWAETVLVGWVGEPALLQTLPGMTTSVGPYHKDEATEGGRAMDVEARGSGGFVHSEHHVGWAPHSCRAPWLHLAHQHIHEVLVAGGGQGSAGW